MTDPIEAEKLEEQWYGFYKGKYKKILELAGESDG